MTETHLNGQKGERDFDDEKAAVQELRKLLMEKRGTLPQAALQACVSRIVKADRLLALVAVQDGTTAGVDRSLLIHAWRKLAQGDEEVARVNTKQVSRTIGRLGGTPCA